MSIKIFIQDTKAQISLIFSGITVLITISVILTVWNIVFSSLVLNTNTVPSSMSSTDIGNNNFAPLILIAALILGIVMTLIVISNCGYSSHESSYSPRRQEQTTKMNESIDKLIKEEPLTPIEMDTIPEETKNNKKNESKGFKFN